MNEPQELRSIDELFRNTFNNLPDTPAENGWDTPSDKVWQHVHNHLQSPHAGWSWQSLLILSGFAVAVVLGLYLAFSPKTTTSEAVKTPAPPAPAARVTTETTPPLVATPTPARQDFVRPVAPARRTVVKPAPLATEIENAPVTLPSHTPVSLDEHQPRSLSAAPLPGTRSTQSPNTTEELKAQHQKQLELLWKTPLEMLPVPRKK